VSKRSNEDTGGSAEMRCNIDLNMVIEMAILIMPIAEDTTAGAATLQLIENMENTKQLRRSKNSLTAVGPRYRRSHIKQIV
jgi:hypothetical protein